MRVQAVGAAARSISLAEEAERLLELAQDDPADAEERARRILDLAGGDAYPRSLAQETLGLAAKERLDLDGAATLLQQAVATAEAAGLATRAAQARMSLCFLLVSRGDAEAALRELALADAVLHGADGARLQMRRGLVLQRLGLLDAALATYDRALPALRRAGDRLWEARLLSNRGVLHTYRRQFAAAERDLLRAERLHRQTGQALAAAQVRHNLGFVAARRGDVPAALRSYDLAAEQLRQLGIVSWLGEADRCELLLSARLLTEADQLATRAVAELARAGMDSDVAEARLTLADVKLLLGEPEAAQRIAEEARSSFLAQGRQPWAVLAAYVLLRARWQTGPRSRALMEEASRNGRDLEAAGWATASVDARLMAARTALELGDPQAAERELVSHRQARFRGPVELRARAWHAEALLRLAHRNRRGADAALRAGMRALDRHRATLGATELRAHVSGHVGQLARLGTRLAIESGDAERVLRWAERWRAGALSLRPVRPPDDEALTADLVALRETVAAIGQAALAGEATTALLRRQARLERSIQQRSRHARGQGEDETGGLPVDALRACLAERALLEMVRLDDDLHAVVVADGRLRLRRLGSHRRAVTELERLQFSLRRLTLPQGPPAALAAARASAAASAQALDDLLIAPVRDLLTEHPLVIVPTGALHAVPWAFLPSCRARPVSVVPSAQLWCRAAAQPHAPPDAGRVVLVGCATPPHAIDEVRALRAHYTGAVALLGDDATVGAVSAALEGASCVHLACHGRFRSDNPLFSCLELADGPLTVFDLERRQQTPPLFLLSACESGLSAVQAGDELMGLAATLFALGTRTLVASVAAVPDAATRRLMVGLHDHLRGGLPPAAALARAQAAECASGDDVAAAGFVCFGAG